ncbi:hypothetical protein MAPG_04286 [Magnaporthiopsis poae ATCC 64411]|uniref:Uncharacterized protein n=1 Tax=Magnaporthiopsis poae (strain ATCC 64411 / 73-15) TaxID=644358 RepID=A0A0C4DWB1_MAGP6|nr:hypothetical protein MAPG_04286 [Magnaporthiopsis poae ATCC 64411]
MMIFQSPRMHPNQYPMPALDATPADTTLAPRKPQLKMANFSRKQLAELLNAVEKTKGDVNGKGSGKKATLADLTVPDAVTKEEVEEELLGGDYEMPKSDRNRPVPVVTKQVDDGLLGDGGYELVDEVLSDTETLSDAGQHQSPSPPSPPVLVGTKGLTAEALAKQQHMTYNVVQWARSQSSGPGSIGAALPQESRTLTKGLCIQTRECSVNRWSRVSFAALPFSRPSKSMFLARPPKAAKAEELPGDESDPSSSGRPSSGTSQGYVPVPEKKQADVDLMFAGGRFGLPTTPPAPVDASPDDIDLEPKKNSSKAGKAHK